MGMSYKGDLMAKLIAPKIKMAFNNFEEMTSQTKYKYYVNKGAYFANVGEVGLNFTDNCNADIKA